MFKNVLKITCYNVQARTIGLVIPGSRSANPDYTKYIKGGWFAFLLLTSNQYIKTVTKTVFVAFKKMYCQYLITHLWFLKLRMDVLEPLLFFEINSVFIIKVWLPTLVKTCKQQVNNNITRAGDLRFRNECFVRVWGICQNITSFAAELFSIYSNCC